MSLVTRNRPPTRWKCNYCDYESWSMLAWHRHLFEHPKEQNNYEAIVLEQEAENEIEESS